MEAGNPPPAAAPWQLPPPFRKYGPLAVANAVSWVVSKRGNCDGEYRCHAIRSDSDCHATLPPLRRIDHGRALLKHSTLSYNRLCAFETFALHHSSYVLLS